LKSQLQDNEKQLLRVQQNEQKLKQECEHTRGQLAEIQRNETTLKSDLANAQRKVKKNILNFILFIQFLFVKHNQLCVNIWRCFSDDDDNDEYDEDQHDIIEQIQQLRQQLDQSKNDFQRQHDTHLSWNEQLRISFGILIDILVSFYNNNNNELIKRIFEYLLDKCNARTNNRKYSFTCSTTNY
jgi:hypothetical protein